MGPRPDAADSTLRVRSYPFTIVIFAFGLLLRGLLLPITHGSDFNVWELDAHATLNGINIYEHEPRSLPHPSAWAYLPLFLYAELPLEWLSLHAHLPFTVMGKLPIVLGDVLVSVSIAAYLKNRGHHDKVIALGIGLYFLNPLVLYNGSYYGRFDAFCLGLFLVAVYAFVSLPPRSWAFPVFYSLAISAKTFPIFILPWLLRRASSYRPRLLVALILVLCGIALPYLISSPKTFIYVVALFNQHRLPTGETWLTLLRSRRYCPIDFRGPCQEELRTFSSLLLVVYIALLFFVTAFDLAQYCAVALVLFLVFSKIVYEQYLLWPLPFLILEIIEGSSWPAAAMFLLLSTIGILDNAHIHTLTRYRNATVMVLAGCIVVYGAITVAHAKQRSSQLNGQVTTQ